jgi:hypothetical protein
MKKKDALPCINFLTKKFPYKGLGVDSEEKHEPASDIDAAAAGSLKVLDPKRPIREADIRCGAEICPLSEGLCCKSRFARMIKNSAGYRRGFRVKM